MALYGDGPPEGVELTCPRRELELKDPNAWEALRDFGPWQRGQLRVAGGVEDQPALWWSRCLVIADELGVIDAEDAERAKREREREARKGGRRG